MSKLMFQQGDVIIERVDDLTDEQREDLKPIPRRDRGVVLADGEVTGHAHVIDAPHANLFENPFDPDSTGLLVLEEEAEVVHEEHNRIKLPKGTYKIRQVMEYDHFEEKERAVID